MLKKFKEHWYIPIVIAVVVVVNLFFVRIGATSGVSMEPTLLDGAPIIINLRSEIGRKDIIVFKNNGTYLVKRIIGLPGETIQIKNNIIYINDEPITDAVNIKMKSYGAASDKVVLNDDEYFVMGDNRNSSYDSREFGPIKKDTILGKVIYDLKSQKGV